MNLWWSVITMNRSPMIRFMRRFFEVGFWITAAIAAVVLFNDLLHLHW
jgi:hypothetical protein